MKVRPSVKPMCEHCKVIRRKSALLIQSISNAKVNNLIKLEVKY